MKHKNIALYSPYIPKHVGGGERYLLSVAEYLAQTHTVTVLMRENVRENDVRDKYAQTFHLDLSKVKFVYSPIANASSLEKVKITSKYDVMYYLTDGSLFFSAAKRNVLHIQFPFTFPKTGRVERLKLVNWGVKNTNSQFTRSIVEKAWKTGIGYVHEPYVDSDLFVPAKKEKIILSVGRFFSGQESGLHCKRQDVLVKAFASMVQEGLNDWKLVLVGPVEPGEDNARYAAEVAALAKGLPVKIFHDASFDVLRRYYAAASIYWHAAGFEVDEHKEPLKVEHFGISVLEAMSSGAIPVVVKKGGLKEIVVDGVSGYLWDTTEQLAQRTNLLAKDEKLREKLAVAARRRATDFSKERFNNTLEEMIG